MIKAIFLISQCFSGKEVFPNSVVTRPVSRSISPQVLSLFLRVVAEKYENIALFSLVYYSKNNPDTGFGRFSKFLPQTIFVIITRETIKVSD